MKLPLLAFVFSSTLASAGLWETVTTFPQEEFGAGYRVTARSLQYDAMGRAVVFLTVLPPNGSTAPTRWVLKTQEPGDSGWKTLATYAYPGADRLTSIQMKLDAVGRAYIVGWADSASGSTGIIRRCDTNTGQCENLLEYRNDGESTLLGYLAFSQGRIFAAGNAEHWFALRSSDDGKTWQRVDHDQLFPGYRSASWAVCAAPSGRVYVTGYALDSTLSYHWRVKMSTDLGEHWQQIDDFQIAKGKNAGPERCFVDSEERLFSVGRSEGVDGGNPGVIRRYDPASGNWLTADVFHATGGGVEYDEVLEDADGRVFVIGSGDGATYVRESDDLGASWSTIDRYVGPESLGGFYGGLTTDALGELYVSGRHTTSAGGTDGVIRHYLR